MLKSFRNKETEALANNRYVKQFNGIQGAARKKLDVLKAAKGLSDLAAVPGNRLEALHSRQNFATS
jgi:toxin HigB-1